MASLRPPFLKVSRGLLTLVVAALAAPACDLRRGEVREWTVADHGAPPPMAAPEPAPLGGGGPSTGPAVGAPSPAPPSPDPLVQAAWGQHCTPCHGPEGRGDGPQGPMVRAPDLTRASWLASASDEQLVSSIRQGKGAMPSFAQLPASVIQGLVRRIRAGGQPERGQ